MWKALLNLKALRRVANFANSMSHSSLFLRNELTAELASMRVFAPDMFDLYDTTLADICKHDASLKRNYPDNVFASASINFGPRATAYVHTDHLNLAYGWCAITAIGKFDPRRGGHLILWDLRLIIEFPPGSTILIPSAILRHSNAPLGDEENERRSAFLQYSAGGLFRWVECEHQTQKSFFASGRKYSQSGEERWRRGVGIFSKWEELKTRIRPQSPSVYS